MKFMVQSRTFYDNVIFTENEYSFVVILVMDSQHRNILKAKSPGIAGKINIKDLRPLLFRYRILNKYMWEEINTAHDLFDILPSRGPKAFKNIIKILKEAKYVKEAEILENATVLTLSKTEYADNYYTMNSDPLGYCLLINNVKFEESEERYGSNVDAENMKKLLNKIGFDVTIEENLGAAQLYHCIEEFSKSDFDPVDSVIIIILSHGGQHQNEDFITGTDEQIIKKKHIYNMFNNRNSKLQGKPKIFFFIACRGDNKDYGASKYYPNESIDATSGTDIIPTLTDIFIIHSSLPGDVSVRDHDKGSWFCQDFLHVLEKSYNKCDLETILKDVNKKISKRISKLNRNVQVIHTENFGWMKGIMLCKQADIVQP